jgi:hypothetical protein
MNGAHVVVSEPGPEEFVPLLVPIAAFGALSAIVVAILYFRYRSQRLRQELYASFLDRGVPIPAELISAKPRKHNGDLRTGMVLLLGGFGLSVALLLANLTSGAGFGLIPALIGVAYLLVWKVESGSHADRAES